MGGWGTQLGVRQGKLLGPWTKLSLHKEGVSTCFSHLCSQGFMVMLFPQNLDNRCPSRGGGHVFTRHRLYIHTWLQNVVEAGWVVKSALTAKSHDYWILGLMTLSGLSLLTNFLRTCHLRSFLPRHSSASPTSSFRGNGAAWDFFLSVITHVDELILIRTLQCGYNFSYFAMGD